MCRINYFQVARHVRPNPLCLRAMRGHANGSARPVACQRDGTTTLPRSTAHLDQSAMIIVTLCMSSQDHGTVTITPSVPANARIRDPIDSPPLIVGSGAAMHTSIRSARCASPANWAFIRADRSPSSPGTSSHRT